MEPGAAAEQPGRAPAMAQVTPWGRYSGVGAGHGFLQGRKRRRAGRGVGKAPSQCP